MNRNWIGEPARAALRRAVRKYRERTEPFFPRPGAWRDMDDDAIWKHVVYQVAVVGGSASQPRLAASEAAQRELRFERLRALDDAGRRRAIHAVLRAHGVRYAAAEITRCRKTSALARNLEFLAGVAGGPKGYLERIAALPGDELRAARASVDLAYVKLKGARDLLAELGVVTDVIALDSRLLGILEAVGVHPPADVQISPKSYAVLQRELIEGVARPEGITGVQLDRILYRNYESILADAGNGIVPTHP